MIGLSTLATAQLGGAATLLASSHNNSSLLQTGTETSALPSQVVTETSPSGRHSVAALFANSSGIISVAANPTPLLAHPEMGMDVVMADAGAVGLVLLSIAVLTGVAKHLSAVITWNQAEIQSPEQVLARMNEQMAVFRSDLQEYLYVPIDTPEQGLETLALWKRQQKESPNHNWGKIIIAARQTSALPFPYYYLVASQNDAIELGSEWSVIKPD